ncbi:cytochrome b-c1 complex subunit 7-like [Glandiceps talaboti]
MASSSFTQLGSFGRNLQKNRGWIALGKWFYNRAGFNRLGLLKDDTISERFPEVKEAIKRLPEDVYDERMFRIKRALDLSLKHRVLPKEQWTQYDDDKPYLQPYIDEVLKEMKEQREWNKQ